MATGRAQPAVFTRPGTMIVTGIVGQARAEAAGNTRTLKVDERLRAEVTLRTERRSTLNMEFGNGALLKLGSDSEVVVDEFWQLPHSQPGKMADWKEEPSPSQTRLRLARGDVTLTVLPLKTARGSSCTLESLAGSVRITGGVLFVRIQMTELGLGVCQLDLRQGAAEFEAAGGAVTRLAPGKPLALAIEVGRAGGVKLSEAPKAGPARN